MSVTIKRKNFLNPAQKKVKQKIMEEMFDSTHRNLVENKDKLDNQACIDILFSCAIMFSSEILIRLILGHGDLKLSESICTQFGNEVIKNVQKSLREVANKDEVCH
jgi:hypothetical protein